MRQKSLMLLGLTLGASLLGSAQKVYVTEGQMFITDVTNQGVAVVHPDQGSAHYLWNAANNTYTYVGGISAGDGAGGVARFSPDGKRVFSDTKATTSCLTQAGRYLQPNAIPIIMFSSWTVL